MRVRPVRSARPTSPRRRRAGRLPARRGARRARGRRGRSAPINALRPPLPARGADAGLASGRARLLRRARHPGRAPFETVRLAYGDAGAVAGPLRPGHARRRRSRRACDLTRRRPRGAQGPEPGRRQLLGLPRGRPAHADGARRLPARARRRARRRCAGSPPITASPGARSTPARRGSRPWWSRTRCGGSTWTARSPPPGRGWRRPESAGATSADVTGS